MNILEQQYDLYLKKAKEYNVKNYYSFDGFKNVLESKGHIISNGDKFHDGKLEYKMGDLK